jgi:hypothetical protein
MVRRQQQFIYNPRAQLPTISILVSMIIGFERMVVERKFHVLGRREVRASKFPTSHRLLSPERSYSIPIVCFLLVESSILSSLLI